jgi:hypothetical protein
VATANPPWAEVEVLVAGVAAEVLVAGVAAELASRSPERRLRAMLTVMWMCNRRPCAW